MYKTRDPTLIDGGTEVLVKSNVEHALVEIHVLNSLRASAIVAKLNAFETVIRAVYQCTSKPLVSTTLTSLLDYTRAINSYSARTQLQTHRLYSRRITSRGRKLTRHPDKTCYAFSAPHKPTYSSNRQKAAPDIFDIFLLN